MNMNKKKFMAVLVYTLKHNQSICISLSIVLKASEIWDK